MGHILIIDSNEESCDNISQFFRGLDHSTSQAYGYSEALLLLDSERFDVVISDVDIPGADIRELIRSVGKRQPKAALIVLFPDSRNIQEELGEAAKSVFRALQKPFYDAELHFQVKRALESALEDEAMPEGSGEIVNLYSGFIGQSPAIDGVFRLIGKVARTDASVIILGETGTGKELVARTLHHDSLRAAGPFVSVNCAALPEQLLESELFGYEKGAFTGADRMRVGRFEHANGGTIFLDEVADMSLVTQAKLLRVLQQREFERLGSNVSVKTDVRIISATNKDLVRLMRAGEFREDLFYRLDVVTIRLPPLREREGDIALLLAYFLKRSCAKMHKRVNGFTNEALSILTGYRWPGNIREMENTLDRAVLMASGDTISAEDLDLFFDGHGEDSSAGENAPAGEGFPVSFGKTAPVRVWNNGNGRDGNVGVGADWDDAVSGSRKHTRAGWVLPMPPGGITLEEAERQLIEQAMERCGGSQKRAAVLLGVSPRVLNYKLMNLRRE